MSFLNSIDGISPQQARIRGRGVRQPYFGNVPPLTKLL